MERMFHLARVGGVHFRFLAYILAAWEVHLHFGFPFVRFVLYAVDICTARA